jgi:hypothetical protein
LLFPIGFEAAEGEAWASFARDYAAAQQTPARKKRRGQQADRVFYINRLSCEQILA